MPPMQDPDGAQFELAIDTATARGGVAIGRDGTPVETYTLRTDTNHAAGLLPAIAEMCKRHNVAPCDLNRLYLSIGPGSFTGLRIGVTIARTLAFAGKARIVPVPTLDVIAAGVSCTDSPPEKLVVLMNARRHRAYAAQFEIRAGQYERITVPAEVDLSEFIRATGPDVVYVGDAIDTGRAELEAAGARWLNAELAFPSAAMVLRLGSIFAKRGEFTPASKLVPFYASRPSAEVVRLRNKR